MEFCTGTGFLSIVQFIIFELDYVKSSVKCFYIEILFQTSKKTVARKDSVISENYAGNGLSKSVPFANDEWASESEVDQLRKQLDELLRQRSDS